MNNIPIFNLTLSFGVLLFGLFTFEILGSYQKLQNFHKRGLIKNFFYHLIGSQINLLRFITKAKYTKVSYASYILINLIIVICVSLISYSLDIVSDLQNSNSVEVIFMYLLNTALILWFYKKNNFVKNVDVNIVNYIYFILMFIMNIVVTDCVGDKFISTIGNIVSLVLCLYLLFLTTKDLLLITYSKLESLVVKVHLVTFTLFIIAIYKSKISLEIIRNEHVEVIAFTMVSLSVFHYIFKNQIIENEIKKSETILKTVFKFTLFISCIRLLCWNI